MKILWIYYIIVKSLSIDFRREKEKMYIHKLEWSERTLPGDTELLGAFKGLAEIYGCSH